MRDFWKKFSVEIFTPATRVFGSDSVGVKFPASDGMAGILPGHAPMVAMIGEGELTVARPEATDLEFFITGGFLQFRENAMTILAEQCVPADQLDREEAWQRIQDARRLPTETPEQIAAQDAELAAARRMFRMSQRAKAARNSSPAPERTLQ